MFAAFVKHPLLLLGLSVLAGCQTIESPADSAAPAATPAWVSDAALYEVFVRDFSPTGDFDGVTATLHRIEATGANVVWLMPIHPVGEENRKGTLGSSYSVRDYRALNPEYGDEQDFRELVSAAHAAGLKVIIDWVPNHTAWDHAWITEHPDWYTRNEQGEMTEPRNDDGSLTGWTDVAELDYDHPGLRREMIETMRWWIEEFDIDGFRVDVAGMVPDDFWREALPELRAAGPVLLLAEWGDPRMHELGFDLTYGWDAYATLKAVWRGERPAADFVTRELDEAPRIPAGAGRLRFTTNHDETAWDEPPILLFGGPAGARAAYAAIALLPGAPLLYNGQEVESPQQLGLFEREPIEWDQPDAEAARAFYARVIQLARTHPSFRGDDLELVATDAANDVIAYRRGDVVVLVNARPRALTVSTPGLSLDGARDLLSGSTQRGDAISLAAHGALVLELDR